MHGNIHYPRARRAALTSERLAKLAEYYGAQARELFWSFRWHVDDRGFDSPRRRGDFSPSSARRGSSFFC